MWNYVVPVGIVFAVSHLVVELAVDKSLFTFGSRVTGQFVVACYLYWAVKYAQYYKSRNPKDSPKKQEDDEYLIWTLLKSITGVLLTINFLIFWALPIGLQASVQLLIIIIGSVWKAVLHYPFRPIYELMDKSIALREFGAKYIYRREPYTDYFAQQILVLGSGIICFLVMLFWQLQNGELPAWLIVAYYFSWVGFGGRVMGGAYTFAHRESHNNYLYQDRIRNTVGNIFENWLGNLFGNVPYNFTTSHISVHHKLQAGMGDTFYQWDFDRSSWADFMIFLQRILSHMSGWSSLMYFKKFQMPKQYNMLFKGMIIYWFIFPSFLFIITRSVSFLYYVWLQPLFCMTFFIAFMNFGYHGFVEFTEKGEHIWCVNSIAIIEGDDDYFGEDDHMAHHYATNVYHRDLEKYRHSKEEDYKKYHGSVFRKFSIIELALFILMKDWDRLADHYVDYTGQMKKEDIMKMLATRAACKDMTNQEYIKWQRQKEATFKGRDKI